MANYKAPVSIPTLKASLDRLSKLPEDIKLIREKEGLGLTQLARTCCVPKSCLHSWEKGESTPREPLTILSLMAWADKIRARQEKVASAS
jgi:DNA-binding transcriptional regulator YiaG